MTVIISEPTKPNVVFVQAIKQRHWTQIIELTKKDIDVSSNFKLSDLFSMKLNLFQKEVGNFSFDFQ